MIEDHHIFDRPFLISILSIVWINAIEVIKYIPIVLQWCGQMVIATLTIIYLLKKIKQISKLNKTVNHEQKDDQNRTVGK